MPDRLCGAALIASVLTVGCGDSTSPTAPTTGSSPSPAPAVLSCPASVTRQSVDALPVPIAWTPPTVEGIAVDKGRCSPSSGTAFRIGTSTVTCTADESALATACSFSITITPPDAKLRFTRFLAFGDSITEGFVGGSALPRGVTARELPALLRAASGRTLPGLARAVQPLNAYPAQLRTLLTQAYTTQVIGVVNDGRSGERAAQGVSRLRSSLLAGQPQVLLLLEGFNDIDLALAKSVVGDGSPIDILPIADDLRTMARIAQGLGIEVLLATLTPVTDVFAEANPGARPAIAALNREIRRMDIELGLSGIVDIHTALAGVPGLIGADGFHPTVTGYQRMAEMFFTEIAARYDVTPQSTGASAP